jgi:hypothetical protein
MHDHEPKDQPPAADREDPISAAQRGTQGPGGPLPFLDQIQRAFGRHDISNIRAHQGVEAARAAADVGAEAFALGDHVVFGKAPDLHLAAHEATHVVQQRAGHGPGDGLEQHADEVAARVVRGESAEPILDRVAPGRSAGSAPPRGVQMVKGLAVDAEVTVKNRKPGCKITAIIDADNYEIREPGAARNVKVHERDVTLAPPKPEEPKPFVPKPGMEINVQSEKGIWIVVSQTGPSYKVRPKHAKPGDTSQDLDVKKWAISDVSAATRKLVEQAEKTAPLVVGDSCKCPIVDPERVFEVIAVRDDKLVIKNQYAHEVERWMTVHKSWKPVAKQDKTVGGEHTLLTDELIGTPGFENKSAAELGTPASFSDAVTSYDGKVPGALKSEAKDFKDTARIDVSSRFTDDKLTIEYVVSSNPEYMCARQYPKGDAKAAKPDVRDLVPLQLETAPDEHAELIAVVEPSAEKNVVSGSVSYTWKALAEAIRLKGAAEMSNSAARDAVTSKYKMLGVKAQWLATVAGKNNQNHTSGGINQKGGSGVVPLEKIASSDFLATEKDKRITSWNMGEKLKADRAVLEKFPGIMAEGRELATTLEAESEFRVEPEKFKAIVTKMDSIASTKEYWDHFGIQKMSKSDPKQYVDTYYDIAGSAGHDNALLENSIVLRERHVATDPADTFLFAVKGHSHGKEGTPESIRLAAQVNLDRKGVTADGGAAKLDALVKDTSIDNAFGRTLDHALSGGKTTGPGGTEMAKLMGDTGHVKPALQIKSTRHKFLMELAGGTAIDFSADEATGFQIDGTGKVVEAKTPPIVYSFEFGVGHPSLTASATPSQAKGAASVQRPYHAPQDLDNPELFDKADYKQFQKLRDDVIKDALAEKGEKFDKGGNKAHLLAGMLGMIGKQ